jgi:hypothetical protein
MFNISDVAIAAISETMETYASGTRASILFAQMQSGKTKAFLLLAGEMIRTQKVDNVVIFTGNREKELKEQLHTEVKGNEDENSFFDKMYCNYLAQKTDVFTGLSFLEGFSKARELIREIKSKITIVWGTELVKKAHRIATENTLFIFEESHFAQSLGQSPSKFLETIGLPANGDNEMLEEKNNYYCSISATPFSELCDNGNFSQSKQVVRMAPGSGYRGVKWLKENSKIIGFEDWETTLRHALYAKKEEGGWAIIRVRGNEQMETAETICRRAEWDVRKYDQEHSDIVNMKELKQKPTTATIVILRERCRMGTAVPKDHLAFLFETSTSSKTDTLLQGLLGRACGYHQNDSLVVYINRDLLNSGEIQTYIDFCGGSEESVPENAKNVVRDEESVPIISKGNKKLSPVIPIHIPRRCITEQAIFKETEAVVRDVLNALQTDDEVIQNNHNTEIIKQKIIHELEQVLAGETKINKHKISKSNKAFKDAPSKILKAIQNRKPAKLGSGCGGCSLYYVDEATDGMETKSYYLCCYLLLTQEEITETYSKRIKRLPQTNGREIFRYHRNFLETGEIEIMNGGFCLSLRPETSTDETIMLETIRECVLRSRETETYLVVPSRINSIRQPGFEKFTGVYLSLDVYKSLLFGGNIFNTISEEFGVTLKLTKNRGRPSKMPEGCTIRLAEISW